MGSGKRDLSTNPVDLDRIAKDAHFEAAQAEILGAIVRDVPNYLERRRPVHFVSPETVFIEHFRTPDRWLQWLMPALWSYLQENQRYNLLVGRTLVHRYVFLPFPSLEPNWSRRRLLINSILINLHVQLWFGVVCGVIFIDPRQISLDEIAELASFFSLPRAGFLYSSPNFHLDGGSDVRKVYGQEALSRMDQVLRSMNVSKVKPIWLYYDGRNYEGPKLSGWRWESLRRFFDILWSPVCCLGCGKRLKSFALDHIAPYAKGHFQTIINFEPLCVPCNSAKGTIVGDDPFCIRIILPEELRLRRIDDAMRLPPCWLGRIRRPQNVVDVVKSLSLT
jgi:hypothetical protein